MSDNARVMGAGSLVVRPGVVFDSVKVFSATMFQERTVLGDRVSEWMARNPRPKVTEFVVTQSSDASFHCVTITVFFRSFEPSL